ncbi:branched-chain-amino-acid aminotransferase [Pilimelia anulata]|uniref:Branched-chain-amino-acid aminotransferase n=1 Tax=Pilimelia anulata TaxID=53371 RepID=A0A8J3B8B0_9ACTN|nr:branched-chain amino acid aminotransferase [Pilimelia anulata]GGJ83994.1 branched-chain-amino-acid aminotransferase [Pilimelia anulata]
MSDGDLLAFDVHPRTTPTPPAERAALLVNPGFGNVFTDHMVTIRYTDGKGWHDGRVEARAPIALDPASAVLHYAQEIFEGLKAYPTPDGGVALFRPDANARRFQRSADRLAMPRLPEQAFLDSIAELVRIDRDWVPTAEGGSLYLRPFMFASEAFLGVRPAREYLYVLIASPAGAYFSGGIKPVTLWISQEYTRAAPGGTGAAKCGGNYAASLNPLAEATANGCDQAVFLDAVEHRYVEELGGMNVFFVHDDDTIVTPQLTGTILEGVTRESIITLAERAGYRVSERQVTIDEWRDDARSGRLREVFACGTAAVITPVGAVRSPDGEFVAGDGRPGRVTMALRKALMDIQRGVTEDPYGWVRRIL